jgi:hypothetical protein
VIVLAAVWTPAQHAAAVVAPSPAAVAQRAASAAPHAVVTAPGQPSPSVVLERYAAALKKTQEPQVITFDYTLEQTGTRTLSQTHRVFRSGNNERDETLTVDGKRLSPPKVRIFRGRRNRYTLALLAPRQTDYVFRFAGTQEDGHHLDYIFRLTPKSERSFAVTDVTIDGVRFLPLAIDFATGANDGAGSIAFGSNARWWVPYAATARASLAAELATERLTFYTYRFPHSLPPSTFTQARRIAPIAPATLATPFPIRPTAPADPDL